MPTVSVAMDDAQFEDLSKCAWTRGVTVEELMRECIDEYLKRASAFDAAAMYVLKKNEELYLRLSQQIVSK